MDHAKTGMRHLPSIAGGISAACVLILLEPAQAGAQPPSAVLPPQPSEAEPQLELPEGSGHAEAAGGSDGEFEGRIGAGFALPTFSTALTEEYTPGYAFSGELGLAAGRWHLALAAHYSRVFLQADPPSLTDRGSGEFTPRQTGSLAFTELLALGRFDLTSSRLRPYVLAGAGVTYEDPTGSVRERSGAEEAFRPSLTAGFGATEVHGPFGLFLQLRMSLMLRDAELTPVALLTAGAALSSL
jgi:hypothetical protein